MHYRPARVLEIQHRRVCQCPLAFFDSLRCGFRKLEYKAILCLVSDYQNFDVNISYPGISLNQHIRPSSENAKIHYVVYFYMNYTLQPNVPSQSQYEAAEYYSTKGGMFAEFRWTVKRKFLSEKNYRFHVQLTFLEFGEYYHQNDKISLIRNAYFDPMKKLF